MGTHPIFESDFDCLTGGEDLNILDDLVDLSQATTAAPINETTTALFPGTTALPTDATTDVVTDVTTDFTTDFRTDFTTGFESTTANVPGTTAPPSTPKPT